MNISRRTASAHPPDRSARPLVWTETFELSGLELPLLTRYAIVAVVIAGCALLSVWSRIDYREASLSLGALESELLAAQSEAGRLQLELAALRTPTRLQAQSAVLALDSKVPVVDLTANGTPATP